MGHQPNHFNLAGLANAVGPVGGLVLRGGIPPGIVMDDHVRAGEVQSRTAGLEGNEENLRISFVKLRRHLHAAAGRGFPIQIHAGIARCLQLPSENFEHGSKLGKQ